MLAVLNCIHGNLEALTAVLADARAHGATRFYTLGDVVGYGPDPEACIDLSMTMDVVLRGNYDVWLFREIVSGAQDLVEYMRALGGRLVFAGHTHVPGVMTLVGEDEFNWNSPEEIDYRHLITPRKALVNVGSVGQPRDGDPRACYVLFDGKVVTFRRVEYDVEATIAKMTGVPDFWGDRLRDGR